MVKVDLEAEAALEVGVGVGALTQEPRTTPWLSLHTFLPPPQPYTQQGFPQFWMNETYF